MKFWKLIINFSLVFVLLISTKKNLLGQTLTNTPYAYDGIGYNLSNCNIEVANLGRYSTSYNSPFSINSNNPASFKSIVFTTFQSSISFGRDQQTYNDSIRKTLGGNFNYASLAFPVNKWIGAGFGFTPYSSFGFDLEKKDVKFGTQSANINYYGDGAINKVFGAIAINPFALINDSLAPNFSIGISPSYLFGKSNRSTYTQFTGKDTNGYYNIQTLKENNYQGYNFIYGIQNKFSLNKNWGLNLGISYSDKIKLENKEINLSGTTNGVSGILLVLADTFKTKQYLPASISGGIGISFKEIYQLFLDYKQQDWSKITYLQSRFSGNKNQIYSAGLQITPKPDLKGNFFERCSYRAGGSYATGSLRINGQALPEYSVSMGVGIAPNYQRPPMLNISFEYSQRGAKNLNVLFEQFYKINLGITINDKWFIKRRID